MAPSSKMQRTSRGLDHSKAVTDLLRVKAERVRVWDEMHRDKPSLCCPFHWRYIHIRDSIQTIAIIQTHTHIYMLTIANIEKDNTQHPYGYNRHHQPFYMSKEILEGISDSKSGPC